MSDTVLQTPIAVLDDGKITFRTQESTDEFLRLAFPTLEAQLEELRTKMEYLEFKKESISLTPDKEGVPTFEVWSDNEELHSTYIATKGSMKDFVDQMERKSANVKMATVSECSLQDASGKTIMEQAPVAIGIRTDKFTGLHPLQMFDAFKQVLEGTLASRFGGKMFNGTPYVSQYEVSPEYIQFKVVLADLVIPTQYAKDGDVLSVWVNVKKGNIGNASFSMQAGVTNLICDNGWTRDTSDTIRIRHVGSVDNMIHRIKRDGTSQVAGLVQEAKHIADGAAVLAQQYMTSEEVQDGITNVINYLFGYTSDAPDIYNFPKLPTMQKQRFMHIVKDKNDAKIRRKVTHLTKMFKTAAQHYSDAVGPSPYAMVQALSDKNTLNQLSTTAKVVFQDFVARWLLANAHLYEAFHIPTVFVDHNDIEHEVLRRRRR